MDTINQNEMMKLAFGLYDRGIEFKVKSFFDGLQFIIGDWDWDAICHNFSYGHEAGLIEVLGLPQCQGDAIGYLTAEDVLKMVDELRPIPESEIINYNDYEPTPTPVKMRMTQKLANDLMDSLAALDISANGRLPVSEEELQSCEKYARETFVRLCEEWEKTVGGTWEITSDENNTYDF